MATRQELMNTIQNKLDALELRIMDLKRHLTDEVEDTERDWEDELEEAEEEKNDLAKLMDEIQDTADDAWEGVKDRFESLVNAIRD